ncbi:carboxypeptidase M32 [Sinanaerobacter sp. ZZT-01]|uniref:carboxypeptidase M32 n=1 Tax=Sinanaerobacter sp. ZZT-01 TaxID=3111540 RepID=UPI002D770B61|nr:carboxypeptidase M32 [Sinanaerobacter sp. ZZT-01]WRR94443.1 carboxypeptidase M32 [Sinanaerobacter sp. ZZT-01]
MVNKQTEKYSKMLSEFKETVRNIEYLKYTLNSLIYWDKITNMPINGIEYRSQVMGYLGDELYRLLSSKQLKRCLNYFDGNKKNDDIVNGMVARIKRNHYYVEKIPKDEYREYISLIANAEQVWEKAKAKNDFKLFQPYLEKIVEKFKSFAEYWGYEENAYDALLGYYEEGVTVNEIDKMSSDLRDFIIELLNQIRQKEDYLEQDSDFIIGLETGKQKELSEWVLTEIGFNFDSGRLDEGAHPTTLACSPDDVRIVTAYNETDIRTGIFNALHEGGKGLYEQDIDKKLLGTLLAEVASFGVEESIGRFYENVLGRSKAFSTKLYDKLRELSAEVNIFDAESFYKYLNHVRPSLIRIDADELTYMLHIIIRYEIEKDLIHEKITVAELPEVWNQKYREYLGIEPDNDREGVLQDIHWAAGYFGFFPSYFLANLVAAQLAAMMEKEIGSIEELISQGCLECIHDWLAENVHKKGAVYSTSELIKKITGGAMSSEYYMEYLKKKYDKVYHL